jgi:hypothetical protein
MTRTATLAAAALGLALSAAFSAPAKANDVGAAILQGVIGMALGQSGGYQSGPSYGYEGRGYERRAYEQRGYGYLSDGGRDYSDERAVYRQLKDEYGRDAVDDCLDSPRCVAKLRNAWQSGDARRLDRLFAGR